MVVFSITVYMLLKKRLLKKIISRKLMMLYKYAYLAIVTLVSRIALVYVLAKKEMNAGRKAELEELADVCRNVFLRKYS